MGPGIDGHTSPAARPKLVASFQEDESIRVALLSITAAGTGLTLTVGGLRALFWSSFSLAAALAACSEGLLSHGKARHSGAAEALAKAFARKGREQTLKHR